jgi:proteic killer suppression protein
MKSLHFEKLKGARRHQHSLRINDQFRLILEIVRIDGTKRIKIIKIEDYH